MHFSTFFGIAQTGFLVVSLLVTGVIVFVLATGITRWSKNNRSPRLTVPATVVAKRVSVSRYRQRGAGDLSYYHTANTYYATFQVDSGDRIELCVGQEFGLLVEGDRGMLSFQGTRYLGFVREEEKKNDAV